MPTILELTAKLHNEKLGSNPLHSAHKYLQQCNCHFKLCICHYAIYLEC